MIIYYHGRLLSYLRNYYLIEKFNFQKPVHFQVNNYKLEIFYMFLFISFSGQQIGGLVNDSLNFVFNPLSYKFFGLHRSVGELEIQISSCSVKGVMVHTTAIVSNLHIRCDRNFLFPKKLSMTNQLMHFNLRCRMLATDLICVPSTPNVIAVILRCLEMA